jgi:hypothetical protein
MPTNPDDAVERVTVEQRHRDADEAWENGDYTLAEGFARFERDLLAATPDEGQPPPYVCKRGCERDGLKDTIAALSARLARVEAAGEALAGLAEMQRNHEYNPFEPDNQTAFFKRIEKILTTWRKAMDGAA